MADRDGSDGAGEPDPDDAPEDAGTGGAGEPPGDGSADDSAGGADDGNGDGPDDADGDPADAPADGERSDVLGPGGEPDVAAEEAAALDEAADADGNADDPIGADPVGDETVTDEVATDDPGAGVAQAAGDAIEGATSAFDGGLADGETAPDDEEMPLTEHVEEMALRLLAVLLVVFGVGGVTLFYADELINFLWYSFIGPGLQECVNLSTMAVTEACPDSVSPRVYHPLALVLARLKMATLVGFVVALPVAVYQTYRFMRPGLYPRERRYYLAAVPTSLVLATVGLTFAYFAVLPALFSYFATYSERAADLAFGLTETFNLIVLMLGFFALVFQIPLLVMLAIMMGITTREWLADRRLYFWGAFAAVAFLFGPDPTGMAPLMMAVTMIVLFDGTLLLLRWTGEGSLVPTAEGLAERRPEAWVLALVAGYVASAAPIPPGYHDRLPAAVTEFVANQGWTPFTPILIAGSLILLFELAAYLLRRFGRSRRALVARLWVFRIRIPLWVLFVAIGYWGSPNPVLLRLADRAWLPLEYAVGLTLGLVVLYELAIRTKRWRENRA